MPKHGCLSYPIALALGCHQLQDAPVFHVLLRKERSLVELQHVISCKTRLDFRDVNMWKKVLESMKSGVAERMNNEWVCFEDKMS